MEAIFWRSSPHQERVSSSLGFFAPLRTEEVGRGQAEVGDDHHPAHVGFSFQISIITVVMMMT